MDMTASQMGQSWAYGDSTSTSTGTEAPPLESLNGKTLGSVDIYFQGGIYIHQ